MNFSYNKNGQIVSLTYPSGKILQNQYDGVGQLSQVALNGVVFGRYFDYDPKGDVTGWEYGNGIKTEISYGGPRGNMSGIGYKRPGQEQLFKLEYSYENNGLINQIQDVVNPGRSITYSYDSLNRLSSASTAGSGLSPRWSLAWSYDRYGNRTSQTAVDGLPPAIQTPANQKNQISSPGFSYDLSGNLLTIPGFSFSYDAVGNKVETNNGSINTFKYDGNGFRVERTEGNQTKDSIWFDGLLIGEYNHESGAPIQEFVYSERNLIGVFEGDIPRFLHSDHLSTRVVSDQNGIVTGEQGHYPFGEVWYSNGTFEQPGFTSYVRNTSDGTDYSVMRYFSSYLGRFDSPDQISGSIDLPMSWNRYSYVSNDPINKTDPFGLCELWGTFVTINVYYKGELIASYTFLADVHCRGGGGTEAKETPEQKQKRLEEKCGENPLKNTKLQSAENILRNAADELSLMIAMTPYPPLLYQDVLDKVKNKGVWDFKYRYQNDPTMKQTFAYYRRIGNANAGMVGSLLGFSGKTTVSVGGIYSIYQNHKGKGIPFISFPYGDLDESSANDVMLGAKYGEWLKCMKQWN